MESPCTKHVRESRPTYFRSKWGDSDCPVFPSNHLLPRDHQAPSAVSDGRMTLKRTTSYHSSRSVKPKTDHSRPTTIANKLDDYLVREILIRLPAKSVTGFKLLSKRWQSLISDPSFVNEHTSRQTNRYACSFFSDCSIDGKILRRTFARSSPNLPTETTFSLGLCESFDYFKRGVSPNLVNETTISLGRLPQVFEYLRPKISASCHGIILVDFGTYNYICVFNPLTKKNQLIPSPLKQSTCCFGLVFGPTSSSPYYYNHYDVVCMVITNKWVVTKTMVRFKIYNHEKGRWRDSKKTTRISFNDWVHIRSNPVCFRGVIHWLTGKGYIIAFNADSEESRMIELPKSVTEMVEIRCQPIGSRTWFGVVEDEVNIVVVTPEHEIVIWVLDDYENNKWEIKRKDVIKTEKNSTVYIQPIFFDGRRLILYSGVERWNFDWVEHDIQTGVSRRLCSTDDQSCFPNVSTLTEVLPMHRRFRYAGNWGDWEYGSE